MREREWLACAAGLYNGEGWASSARYDRRTGGMTATLTLGIGQAHPEVLERFRDAVGIGVVNGPRRVRTTEMWQFRVHGFEKVQTVVAMLWPWLSTPKRRQASRVLQDGRDYAARQPRRHLLDHEVADVRVRLARGESQASIAHSFGKERQIINRIARGRAYR